MDRINMDTMEMGGRDRARMDRHRAILFLAAVFTLAFSVCFGKNLERQSGQVSIRFLSNVISGERLDQIYEEQEKKQLEEEELLPFLTLWKQKEGEPISQKDKAGSVKVKLVELWGDAEQVYPGCLSDGSPLSREDEAGCMLSREAAFQLFGSTDAVGKEAVYEGKTYQVRGILDVEEAVFVREVRDGAFSCLEAQGSPGSGMEPVRRILLQVGLYPEDGAVLEWDALRGILRLFQAALFGLLECCLVRKAAERYGSRTLWVKCVKTAAFLLFFFVLVRSWCFSQDYIPARWSDFEFYGDLFRAQKENYMRYLLVPDIRKDRILFHGTRRALEWGCVSLLCGWGTVLGHRRRMGH